MSALGSVSYRDSVDWGRGLDFGEGEPSEARQELEEPLEPERPKRSFESEGYAFRPRTVEAGKVSQAKTPLFKRRRKILSPSKTASMFINENHACSELNVDHTQSKVTARFFFSLFRFAVSYAWECKTERGRTQYNGASSGCHGRCHAAHAALSPALEDNYLQRIGEKVKLLGYEELLIDEKEYLSGRFIFTENDYKLLSSKVECIRSDFMTRVMKGLEAEKQRGSFVQTPLDYERNVTYEGPAASNRIDCRLEQDLRGLEDELAEKCMMVDEIPKEALRKMFFSYQELLLNLKEALRLDLERYSFLYNLWKDVVKAQTEALRPTKEELESFFKTQEGADAFQHYITAVMAYQEALASRFSNAHGGIPSLKNLEKALNQSQSPYVLSQIISAFKTKGVEEAVNNFIIHFRNLIRFSKDEKSNVTIEEEFQNGKEEINKRILEVEAQLSVTDRGFDELHEVIKKYFDAKDENGNFITPTKKDLREKLNGLLVPTPAHLSKDSTLVRKLKFSSDTDSIEENGFEDSFVEHFLADDFYFDGLSFEDSEEEEGGLLFEDSEEEIDGLSKEEGSLRSSYL